jgi:hypothetical protein
MFIAVTIITPPVKDYSIIPILRFIGSPGALAMGAVRSSLPPSPNKKFNGLINFEFGGGWVR